jgi:ABC-2 type transport system permease protein
MLEASANGLPTALLFLGLATFAFAVLPRAGAAIAYGLVAVMFIWQLVGGLLSAPRWLLDLSPFQHVGMVPAQPFRATAAVVVLVLALLTSLASMWAFRRRDLTGA